MKKNGKKNTESMEQVEENVPYGRMYEVQYASKQENDLYPHINKTSARCVAPASSLIVCFKKEEKKKELQLELSALKKKPTDEEPLQTQSVFLKP